MTIAREELAAFADGELTGTREAEVAAAVAADPALARQVAAHRALKATLTDHFEPIARQPVPDGLAATLAPKPEGEVVDFTAARDRIEARRSLPRWSWVAGPALAASLALVLFLPRGEGDLGPYAEGRLASVLDSRLVAEQSPVAETRILVSFRNKSGDLCRAFGGDEGSGIACRDERGWRLDFMGEASEAGTTDYRMAGPQAAEVLARAQAMAGGPALDAEAEAEARARDWR